MTRYRDYEPEAFARVNLLRTIDVVHSFHVATRTKAKLCLFGITFLEDTFNGNAFAGGFVTEVHAEFELAGMQSGSTTDEQLAIVDCVFSRPSRKVKFVQCFWGDRGYMQGTLCQTRA